LATDQEVLGSNPSRRTILIDFFLEILNTVEIKQKYVFTKICNNFFSTCFSNHIFINFNSISKLKVKVIFQE